MPEDAEIASVVSGVPRQVPRSSVSTEEPYHEQVREWLAAGVQGTTIHAALQRNHGYTDSYDAVKRMLRRLASVSDEPSCPRIQPQARHSDPRHGGDDAKDASLRIGLHYGGRAGAHYGARVLISPSTRRPG